MENVQLTGYEPKPEMARKINLMLKELQELRAEIEKMKAGDGNKKPSKAKSEE